MDVKVLYLVGALLFLPLIPVSLLVSLLLRKGPNLRTSVFLMFPVIGSYALTGVGWESLPLPILLLACFTSLLYAFKSLSVSSFSRWIIYIFLSFTPLVWLISEGLSPQVSLLVGVLFALPFVVSSLTDRLLVARFGTSSFRTVRGLGLGTPLLGMLTALSVLSLMAVPPSVVFLTLLLSLLGLNPYTILSVGLVWLFWGWSGIRVLPSLLFGSPREELSYRDVPLRGGLVLLALNLVSFLGGYILLELLTLSGAQR
jgi:hypothetical protein